MFVFGRWQQIASDAGEGAPDEHGSAARWDECTDRDIAEYKERTDRLIRGEVGRLRALAFAESVSAKLDSLASFAKAIAWIGRTILEHFVGAIGLLFFGLLIVWAFPHLSKDLRSTLDELLPGDTRPDAKR